MADNLFPAQQFIYSDTLSFPVFSEKNEEVFYIKTVDGKSRLVSQNLKTGLSQSFTSDPQPEAHVTYGGRPFAVGENFLVFTGSDNRLHRLELATGVLSTLTPKMEGMGAPVISACMRFIFFSGENDGFCNIFCVDSQGKEAPRKLSRDPWYGINVAVSPKGTHIAWSEWDLGSMPWEESRICILTLTRPLAECSELSHIHASHREVLSQKNAAFSHAQFSPDGMRVAYLSDESGSRSVYLRSLKNGETIKIDTGNYEIGGPDWVVGLNQLQWSSNGRRLFCVRNEFGKEVLLSIDSEKREYRTLPSTLTQIDGFSGGDSSVCILGSASNRSQGLVSIPLDKPEETMRVSASCAPLSRSAVQTAELFKFRASFGQELFGIFYPAQNTKEKKNPLMVHIHGGPTSQVRMGWHPEAQYFVSRGYHFLSMNYRGSTGYGRAYQDLLKNHWGEYDVIDAKEGALALIAKGVVDEKRCVITGGSAGGYTVFGALVKDPTFWAAGISLFGVSDLFALEDTCHRFERGYTALGAGMLPEASAQWRERSPIYFADKIRAPLQMFHGKKDKAVPFEQSVAIADQLKHSKVPCELHLYEEEGHGFRKEKNKKHMLIAKEKFLYRYVICRQF